MGVHWNCSGPVPRWILWAKDLESVWLRAQKEELFAKPYMCFCMLSIWIISLSASLLPFLHLQYGCMALQTAQGKRPQVALCIFVSMLNKLVSLRSHCGCAGQTCLFLIFICPFSLSFPLFNSVGISLHVLSTHFTNLSDLCVSNLCLDVYLYCRKANHWLSRLNEGMKRFCIQSNNVTPKPSYKTTVYELIHTSFFESEYFY